MEGHHHMMGSRRGGNDDVDPRQHPLPFVEGHRPAVQNTVLVNGQRLIGGDRRVVHPGDVQRNGVHLGSSDLTLQPNTDFH